MTINRPPFRFEPVGTPGETRRATMHPDTIGALGALHRQDLDGEATRHSVAKAVSSKRADSGLGRRLARGWSQALAALLDHVVQSQGPWRGARQALIGDGATESGAGQGTVRPAAWVEPAERGSMTVDRQRLAARIGEVRSGDW
ncbi:MAG TPA: hypothetical protein VKR30_11075 [Candidatus Limnocylindrales bacterium]|nr:hypothetical protein [Candidatus Limnocylindrales bacterium]